MSQEEQASIEVKSLVRVAHEVARTADETLLHGWHPQGTCYSARKEIMIGALDEVVQALGEKWEASMQADDDHYSVISAIDAVWAKLDDLNALN